MSKRVLILLGVGALLIAAAFLLLKHELSEKEVNQGEEYEDEAEPEEKPIIADNGKQEQTAGAAETN